MYKIIGADHQPYGPVTADQITQWIAEGRANGQTRTQAEGSADWKTLSAFPEFAAALGTKDGATPPPMFTSATHADTRARAANKIAAGVLGILLGAFGIHKFILGYQRAGLIMLLTTVLTCGLASPIVHLIGLIEGIVYLTRTDEEFVRTYVDNQKEWF